MACEVLLVDPVVLSEKWSCVWIQWLKSRKRYAIIGGEEQKKKRREPVIDSISLFNSPPHGKHNVLNKHHQQPWDQIKTSSLLNNVLASAISVHLVAKSSSQLDYNSIRDQLNCSLIFRFGGLISRSDSRKQRLCSVLYMLITARVVLFIHLSCDTLNIGNPDFDFNFKL